MAMGPAPRRLSRAAPPATGLPDARPGRVVAGDRPGRLVHSVRARRRKVIPRNLFRRPLAVPARRRGNPNRGKPLPRRARPPRASALSDHGPLYRPRAEPHPPRAADAARGKGYDMGRRPSHADEAGRPSASEAGPPDSRPAASSNRPRGLRRYTKPSSFQRLAPLSASRRSLSRPPCSPGFAPGGLVAARPCPSLSGIVRPSPA